MITIPILTTADIAEISQACEGTCNDCPICDHCKEYRDFMDAAGEDFENQCEVVLEELFADPEECDRIRREMLG